VMATLDRWSSSKGSTDRSVGVGSGRPLTGRGDSARGFAPLETRIRRDSPRFIAAHPDLFRFVATTALEANWLVSGQF
jgi:hypothetical protein